MMLVSNRVIAAALLACIGAAATSVSAFDLTPPLHDTWIDHDGGCTFNPCDAALVADPDPLFTVSTREACQRRANGLVRFDLSTIPTGTPIVSAHLWLYAAYQNEYQTNDFHVSRLIEDWVPAQVDWCERANGAPWCTSGGCVTSAGQATATILNKYGTVPNDGAFLPYNEWVTWDVTEIVRSWVSGAAPNFGVLIWQTPLGGHGRNQAISFVGRENPRTPSVAGHLLIDESVAVQAVVWSRFKKLYRD